MNIFVARQPIFDHHLRVYAYELLFRSSAENLFTSSDGDQATCRVVNNTLHVFGLGPIAGGHKTFINATKTILVEELYAVLPREHAVIEILETVQPEPAVIAACHAAKKAGYLLALDDFILSPEIEPLLSVADILKVDFLVTKGEERRNLVKKLAPRGIKLLAEKLETKEEFVEALKLGYTYFQGFFFCKPEVMTRKDIPGYKMNYVRILKEINQPEMDFDRLSEIVKQDVSLSVKLLQYLNSASVGLRQRVTSIKQALVLLGEVAVRRWVWVLTLASLGQDRPTELMVTSLVRGRFAENIAKDAGMGGREYDLFLLGLLSLVDVMMGRPMTEVLEELAVSEELLSALSGDGSPLCRLHALMIAYERGDWEQTTELAKGLRIPEDRIAETYARSVEWADQIFQQGVAPAGRRP